MSKKKKDTILPKFIPMPSRWPGKISNEDLFNEFAQTVRKEISEKSENPLITLRVQQLGFIHHDFILTLTKNATIFHLQNEIARIQHDNAVLPSDILIFKHKVQTPSENLKTMAQDEYSIGISKESICTDPNQTLLFYFPQIEKIKHRFQPTQFLHSLYNTNFPKFTKKYEFDLKLPKIEISKQQDYTCPHYIIYYDVYTYIKLDMFTFQLKGDLLDKAFLKSTCQKKSKTKDKFDIRFPLIQHNNKTRL
ncbi:hypothetical protein HDV06_007143 [Boothiomyces sp. JEL0866]|nr:hypothetical protein HDV06_007143 [Boothiomyces sp. JEL0866]